MASDGMRGDSAGFDSEGTTTSEAENELISLRQTISPQRLQESYAQVLQLKGANHSCVSQCHRYSRHILYGHPNSFSA